MNSRLKYLIALVCAAALFSACDIVEGPKIDPNGFTGSANKVLIEDFTGHTCGYCPRAHKKAAELLDTYGDNLVVVAIHAGSFAALVPAQGYTREFKTEMGNEVEAHFGADNVGLPNGLVNRRTWNGSPITKHDVWSTLVSTVLAEQPKIKMELGSVYSPNDRGLTVTANLEYFSTGDANHHIVALITENGIVSKQKTYDTIPDHIDDYVHDHVLRGSITPGAWGVPVKGNEIFLGEKFELDFSMTLDTNWVAENCNVVVYVMDNVSKEILQVDEIKLTE